MGIEEKVLSAYTPYKTSLREVGRIVGTDHHRVKRILEANGVTPVKAKKVFSKAHKEAISKSCKGRKTWSEGRKMPKASLYRNMAAHIRFDVSSEYLEQFEDIEKLKFLNKVLTRRGGRFDFCTEQYKAFIEHFYNDDQFNTIYAKWLDSGRDKWLMPSIDHINPKAKGGRNNLSNLQFLTLFENRAKCDMSQEDWDNVKANIKDYIL